MSEWLDTETCYSTVTFFSVPCSLIRFYCYLVFASCDIKPNIQSTFTWACPIPFSAFTAHRMVGLLYAIINFAHAGFLTPSAAWRPDDRPYCPARSQIVKRMHVPQTTKISYRPTSSYYIDRNSKKFLKWYI